MVRRLAWFALAAAAACKGGLHTGKGNDFPCDFSQPEGVRDAVCSPGDVCGVDNLCRQYRYEGPQFELGANAPDFSVAVVRHPLVMKEPATLVTRSFEGPVFRAFALSAGFLTRFETGSAATVREAPLGVLSGADVTAAAVTHGSDPFAVVLTREGASNVARRFQSVTFDGGVTAFPMVTDGDRLRTGTRRAALVTRDAGAFMIQAMGGAAPLEARLDSGVDVPLLDVRFLASPSGDEMVALASDGLYFLRQMQPATLISGGEPMPPELGFPGARAELRHDLSGTLAAFTVSIGGTAKTLSTWRIDRLMQPSSVRMWADCRPCRFGRIAAFTPTFEAGAPAVEVLCETDMGAVLSLVRVIGSAAADPTQPCTVEPFDAPFPLSQVNRVSRGRRAAEGEDPFVVSDESFGAGFALAGKRGQLWVGPSLSRGLPLFLDRTPLAFGALPSKEGPLPAVLTDRYLAVVKDPALGFEVLDLRDVGVDLAGGVFASAFVSEALGWGVLSSGDLVLVDPRATDGGTLTFGPRLLDNRGAPARPPYFAEAVTERDGGLISFVLTADDSVYFVPASGLVTTPTPNALMPVTPQLTPAPSAAVRSFALERSALGTDGRERVRAYLVAGRSLFLVTLDGTPPRWAATPLVLQAGEPLEVWMDHPLGGLGRAGYRDGQVFTLPGGFLLVNELPRDAGANPPQVLDYENLGGWPVAMTSNGLFEAHYDVLEGGKLDNRFPDGGVNKAMGWRLVTLPDGGQPWLGKTARLQVTQETVANDGGFTVPGPVPAFVRVFRLLVYTDDEVIEVGRLVRR